MKRKTYLVCVHDRWYAEKHFIEWNEGKRTIQRKFFSLKIQGRKNRTKALRALRDFEGKESISKFIAKKRPSLTDFATNYLEQTKMNVRKNTFRQYVMWIKKFTDRFYDYRLDEITFQEIELFKKELFTKYSAESVNTALRDLKAMFRNAEGKNLIERSPCQKIKFADTPKKILEEFWSKDQFEKFISTVNVRNLRIAFSLSFYAGLRVNEVVNIKWNDINEHSILIRTRDQFRTKNDSSRLVPLFTSLKKELDGVEIKNEYIVTYRGDTISKIFLNYRRKYNEMNDEKLPEITFHGLRHSFASMLVKNISLAELQKIMGHSDIKTTMIYVHLKNENFFFGGFDL